jgi:nitrogenase-associated protein
MTAVASSTAVARIIFYEKPGCLTNARQKAMLHDAGHRLDVRDLLAETWTADRLRAFFGDTPVSQWFSRAAPRVKSGEVDDARTALALMLDDPLLIRRPLMEAGDWRCAGFEAIEVDRAIGLRLGQPEDGDGPLEGCAHGATDRVCATPE